MIKIKSPEEIKIMAEGGKLLAEIIEELKKKVKPGIVAKELDSLAEELILKSGSKCSFKDYDRFPNCLCLSLNEEIVHGIPDDRILKEGDIVSLDLGLVYRGFHADMAVTLPVGQVNSPVNKLIQTTKDSLKKGIEQLKPGKRLGDIGWAIQRQAESRQLSVVKELCGHGIGRDLHEDPDILNYGQPGSGTEIKVGMVFCLEPMLSLGDWHIRQSSNGHSFITADGSLSAHFEHMVAVLADGPQVLTASAFNVKMK